MITNAMDTPGKKINAVRAILQSMLPIDVMQPQETFEEKKSSKNNPNLEDIDETHTRIVNSFPDVIASYFSAKLALDKIAENTTEWIREGN